MAWFWTTIISMIISVWFLQKLKKNKKKMPPGPIALPILGHLHLLGKNLHQDLHHLAQKHGPVMFLRFGLVPAVVVSSSAGAELVLKTHDLVFANRPSHQAFKLLSYDQKNIVFAPYGTYWRNMRKLVTLQLLGSLKIDQFRAMRRAEVGNLVSYIRRAAEMRETVDISTKVSGLSGDMTCLMIFGKKYADRDFDEKGFRHVIEETMQVAAVPNLGDCFPFMGFLDLQARYETFRGRIQAVPVPYPSPRRPRHGSGLQRGDPVHHSLQGLTRRLKELCGTFDGFLERIIDEHVPNKENRKETPDFVDTMMGIMESGEAGFEFDRRHVKAVLLDLLIVGSDTSASAVEWALSELIRHPRCMMKLQKELEQVVGMGRHVEELHLKNLDYLDSVVKETLRLHPVVPLLMHESVEDCTLDGYHVPRGSRLMINVLSIGRDPNVWKDDPEAFKPERFREGNIDLSGHDFELIPFGSGRRGCPGMQLGLIVVQLVVAQLVHCFDWELPDGMLSSDINMDDHFGLVVGREKHLKAIPTYRLLK
ncbi:hypothetical protein OROGR_019030 [Orobanche gracilis]